MLLFNSTQEWISSSPTIISREYQVMILVRSVEKRRGVCRQRQLVLLDIWAVDARQPELGITLHLARADNSSDDQSLEGALDNDTSEDPASYRRAQDLLQFFCNFTSQLNPTWILCSLQWQRLSVYTTNLFSMTNRTKHIIWQQIETSSKDTGWFFWLVRPKNSFWH